MAFMLMDMGTGVFLAAEFAGILSIIAPMCSLFPIYTGQLPTVAAVTAWACLVPKPHAAYSP